jgi:hypothetical protein
MQCIYVFYAVKLFSNYKNLLLFKKRKLTIYLQNISYSSFAFSSLQLPFLTKFIRLDPAALAEALLAALPPLPPFVMFLDTLEV